MSWQDETIPMLRVLINDLGETPDYSESRLEELLLVAASYVSREIGFANDYTVSITSCTISPDPTDKSGDGLDFMNFIVLKAACIVDQSTLRTKAALAGLKAQFGPARLDTLQHLDGFKILMEQGPCATYEQLKMEYMFGNDHYVKGVFSPFVSNNFDPASLTGYRR